MRRGKDQARDPLPHARHVAGEAEDEPPAGFGSWKLLYAIVVVELFGVILLCYWITLHNA